VNPVAAAVAAVAAVAWMALFARVSLVAARMLQIEEYENRRFLRWAAAAHWLAHPAALTAGAFSLAALVIVLVQSGTALVVAAGWLAGCVAAHAAWSWLPAKRALAFTARMRRLLATGAVVILALAGFAAWLLLLAPEAGAALVVVLGAGITALAPAVLVAANLGLTPIEGTVRGYYLRRARAHLGAVDPLVVAIAGSYGKTSTKHILAGLLGGDDVLPTRKSFNTLMGISRVINEDLAPRHRVFIVEMDAYAPGEIRAMCDLVRPRLSVITSVGPQHLERFGEMSRIADALYECVDGLPADGAAVIHVGDPGGASLARRALAAGRTVVRFGLESDGGSADADVIARDVRISSTGTSFRWCWPEHGLEREVEVPLLGRHQALNVSAALIMVRLLGRELDSAIRAAANLEPIEHRLQLLRGSGAVTVIDDSYNANPVGVHEGLAVLASMDGGHKILVTPGLVELGSLEAEENRRYGRHAAEVCDEVIVAEARTAAALLAGLREGGLAPERIHTVRDLAETTALLARLARAGDVVLFANDLPDTYLPGPGARAVTAARTRT
jgi:UDP-N-acetylmuramoyl-tripeptide--D-alanyl-D-alanine ligase